MKFAISFTIAGMFWVKKTRQMYVTRGYKKSGTEFHSPWGEPFSQSSFRKFQWLSSLALHN